MCRVRLPVTYKLSCKSMAHEKLSVLLTTEGTYPFHQGGVSTWCDALVKQMGAVDFTILAIITDPFISQKYTLPDSAKLVRIPLWGTDEPSEHLHVPFGSTYMAKQRTTSGVILQRFIPLFDEFVREILASEKNSEHLGSILLRLYDFFQEFDYKVAFKSPVTWERYKALIREAAHDSTSGLREPDMYSAIQSLGWLYRFFNVLNTRVPESAVAHATAAAFCGIPCVIAKLKYKTPFILTEHGVYLREQYLSLSKRGYSSFLNTFLIRLIWSVTRLNYDFADQISPVCRYNTRWEYKVTDRHERIRMIYNGVDYRPYARVAPRDRERPTVVTVARIDPIKDLRTLILTAAVVRRTIPDVLFLVYGSVTVPEYFEQCEQWIEEQSLTDTVKFMGHTTDMVAAYDAGDVVLQTSISEAFPYSVIEAMLAGKPIVATAVGGVPEAIANTGVLCYPGDAEGLAQAVLHLLNDHAARFEMGEEARRRALNLFTLERSLQEYMRSYIRLAVVGAEGVRRPSRSLGSKRQRRVPTQRSEVHGFATAKREGQADHRRRLLTERALALVAAGYPKAAEQPLREALQQTAWNLADVVRLRLLRSIYTHLARMTEAQEMQGLERDVLTTMARRRQQLAAEKALAFRDVGELRQATRYMVAAIDMDSASLANPVLLLELARMAFAEGRIEEAQDLYTRSLLAAQLA